MKHTSNRDWNLFWRSPWIMGQLVLWSTLLATSFLIALLLRFTPFDESYLPLITYLIHIFALFLSGFYASKQAPHRGWFYGGGQGIIYASVLFAVNASLTDFELKTHPLPLFICCLSISALGGLFGQNEKNRPHKV